MARLGEFWAIGRIFGDCCFFGKRFLNYRISKIFVGCLFLRYQLYINFDKKWLGYNLGGFF
jgi:hypothetical protein